MTPDDPTDKQIGPEIDGTPDEMPSIDTLINKSKEGVERRLTSFDRQVEDFKGMLDRRKKTIQEKLDDPEKYRLTKDKINSLRERLENEAEQSERDLAKLQEIRTQMENGNEAKFRVEMKKVLSAIRDLKTGAEKIANEHERRNKDGEEYSQEDVQKDRTFLHDLYFKLKEAVKGFNTSFKDQDTTELYNREPSLVNETGGNQYVADLLQYPMTLSLGTWRNEFNMYLSILGNIEVDVIHAMIPKDKALAIAEAIANDGKTSEVELARKTTRTRARL